MKKCPFCGAELQDDSLFCLECGKELPKGIECPHCGTSVNEGDVFCTECGKSLDEVEETVPIQQETPIAEDPVVYKEAGAKRSKLGKYIPFIIAAFVLLGLIGYFSSNASSKDNNDVQVTDSISNEVKGIDNGASYTDEDIKESIESMYKEIFNSNSFGEFDKKYTSSEFYSLYKKALEVDDGEVGIDTDHWVQGQDYDKPSMNVISVKKESDNKAIAKINIRQFEDNDDMTLVKLILLYENGRWVVDDFISLWDGGEEYSEKTSLKNYIREIESKPKEDFSWLQGHWRFEEPNFTGHIIIEGDKITQYSSMNPEKVAYTYRIEGNEIRARIADGMEMAIQIDKNKQSINYGGNRWMYKVGSVDEILNKGTFDSEEEFWIKVANQKFVNKDNETISFDDKRKMYRNGKDAGHITIEFTKNNEATVRYSGGECGEGEFKLHCAKSVKNYLDIIDMKANRINFFQVH